ncbi:MAG: succinyl-diaminopimelate desuccinylase [Gammaproteobacteria bacterium]
MSKTLELTSELIRRASRTPEDAGCQKLLAERLKKSDFAATHLRYDDVDNLWLLHGDGDPVFAFLGHTDVVPTGPVSEWQSDPFIPTIRDGYLYGRGAADMKGSIAAMVTAMERFVTANPDHQGSLALLLTSDEEGAAVNGTRRVVDYFTQNGIQINCCLVAEPSSRTQLGDVIKIGRRGSLTARMKVFGVQGHVAYPHLAQNPIHLVAPAVSELCKIVWDYGSDHYPPTSFQISNINAGTGADNVIPGSIEIMFNFRYSTQFTENELIEGVQEVLNRHQLHYEIDWRSSGDPFLSESGPLLDAVKGAIKTVTGLDTETSTEGGTSDGRFIAPTGAEVIELGPVNATIHKVDECVKVEDLETLSRIYELVIQKLLA